MGANNNQQQDATNMKNKNKNKNKSNENNQRILGRRLAKELSSDELHSITGGTTSCMNGEPADCDQQAF